MMLRTLKQQISGWGNYPRETAYLVRPEKYRNIYPQDLNIHSCIARGQGRSYGDAALNQSTEPSNVVLLTQRLNRLIAFDPVSGLLTAEAGITLKEILEVIVPQGWFLPVTPGTQFVSLGGCAASDVHGKNHHDQGSFGQHIIQLELITPTQTRLCSPQHHAALFWATIGGMGLTGMIGKITLQLMPISTQKMQVKYYSAYNLTEIFDYLRDKNLEDDYSVAWIDAYTQKSILMTAHHADLQEVSSFSDKKNSPKNKSQSGFNSLLNLAGFLKSGLLNNRAIRLFNHFYFNKQSQKNSPFILDYQQYFYPLDKIPHWNKLYGKNGFVQYQFVLPDNTAFEGIKAVFFQLSLQKIPSFLAVLKRLGQQNKSLLSFPRQGYTLALDIPFKGQKTIDLIHHLDQIVLAHQGRVYLAKDALLSPESFRRMYPDYQKFLAIKNSVDPDQLFQSSLSRRLKIGMN